MIALRLLFAFVVPWRFLPRPGAFAPEFNVVVPGMVLLRARVVARGGAGAMLHALPE
jgi:hypothetical protein